MDNPMVRAKKRSHITIEDTSHYDLTRTFNLNFYIEPPRSKLEVKELYEIVSDRLKVLKLVFKIAVQNHNRPSVVCKQLLVNELVKHELHDYVTLVLESGSNGNTENCIRIRRNDHVSHFMLKMAVAFDEKKKLWFFQQEVRLFKWRLTSLNEDSIMAFKCVNALPFDPIPESKQKEIQKYLDTCNLRISNPSNTHYFEMAFTKVLDLVKKRNTYIYKGKAFVPLENLVTLFVLEFKQKLRSTFSLARHTAVQVYYDERLSHIFNTVPDCIQTSELAWRTASNVSPKKLNYYSIQHYPLCMRVLHEALRSKHHLTNGGRVQYTLFLKGIGVEMAHTMEFYRDEFLQVMPEKKFNREHAYGVKHLYGKVGSKKDYTPYSCKKILCAAVGSRDHHGCPYKVMSEGALTQKLQKYGLQSEEVNEIVQLSKEGRYQAACSRYFDITHEDAPDIFVEHPNIYFSESMDYWKYKLVL